MNTCFSCAYFLFLYFFGEASVHILSPFLIGFLNVEFKSALFWLQVLCWICDLKIFSPNLWLVFFTLLTVIWQSEVFNFSKDQFFLL